MSKRPVFHYEFLLDYDLLFLPTWYGPKMICLNVILLISILSITVYEKGESPKARTSWRSYTLRPCQRQDDYNRLRLWTQSRDEIIRLKAGKPLSVHTAGGRWSAEIRWNATHACGEETKSGLRLSASHAKPAGGFIGRFRCFLLHSSTIAWA